MDFDAEPQSSSSSSTTPAQPQQLTATALGYISSFYYLKYTTMAMFFNEMKAECELWDLLKILSHASEYEELPVRHNEVWWLHRQEGSRRKVMMQSLPLPSHRVSSVRFVFSLFFLLPFPPVEVIWEMITNKAWLFLSHGCQVLTHNQHDCSFFSSSLHSFSHLVLVHSRFSFVSIPFSSCENGSNTAQLFLSHGCQVLTHNQHDCSLLCSSLSWLFFV